MTPRDHRNNFDATRLFAAFLVIYGHQLQMRGIDVPAPFGVPVSKTGLDIFFSLSGYLITDSWTRDPNTPRFLAKRVLRIMPALIVVVLLSVFVLGPLTTSFPLSAYFTDGETYRYLANMVFLLRTRLPGVFDSGYAEAVNGSLWSLLPEFACYLTVPLLFVLPRLPRVVLLLLLAGGASVVGFQLDPNAHTIVHSINLRFMLMEVCFFFTGSVLRILDHDQDKLYRLDSVLLICAFRILLAISQGKLALMLDPFLLPYLVIAFGRARTPVLQHASRYGDLSYGLYLYAFPVQQWLIIRHVPHPLPVALLVTGLLAWLSWHGVERPALRWKPRASNRAAIRAATPETG